MIPGPYAIYHFTEDDSDGGNFRTLVWGFDTATQAFEAIPEVAAQHDVESDTCVVLRMIDREEMQRFVD